MEHVFNVREAARREIAGRLRLHLASYAKKDRMTASIPPFRSNGYLPDGIWLAMEAEADSYRATGYLRLSHPTLRRLTPHAMVFS